MHYKTRRKIYTVIDIIITWLLVCLVIILLFFANPITVKGDSMEPTYYNHKIIFVNKILPAYERFSVVIAKVGDEMMIKRIVGLPGETVQIIDGYVFINGEKLSDITQEPVNFAGIAFLPLTLGEDEYFLLGDNRNNSRDSRYNEIGVITKEQLKGEVINE